MAINNSLVTEIHEESLDISKVVSGYTEVSLKELHLDNNDEDFINRNLHFVMQDSAGNKRVLTVNLGDLDEKFQEIGLIINID